MRSAGITAKLRDEGSGRKEMQGESEEEHRRKNIKSAT